jgi:secondary thiamine-phosphate synthase enzyme
MRMRQKSDVLAVATRRGLTEITAGVHGVVRASGVREGLCTVFLRHTSASLVIQENADPAVHRDLEAFLSRLVADGDPLFTHVAEGDDDMPSHVKAALLKTSEQVPVRGGELALGTWQGIYVWEHRTGGHRREVVVHVLGE